MSRNKIYNYSTDINDDVITININNVDIKIVKLNGIIFRGDTNDGPSTPKRPAFYGDLKNTLLYAGGKKSENYMKAYETKKKLNLLLISKSNFKNIDKFFRDVLLKDNLANHIVIKMTHIMLQICMGMIDGNMDSLYLWDFSKKDVYLYFKFNEYGLHRDDIRIFMKTIYDFNDANTVPSRMSMYDFDKILMINLKSLLGKYNIHGTWFNGGDENPSYFFGNNNPNPNLLCVKIDKVIDSPDFFTGCVPAEICIFNPKKNLEVKKIIKV